jgi:hypothetical protein
MVAPAPWRLGYRLVWCYYDPDVEKNTRCKQP